MSLKSKIVGTFSLGIFVLILIAVFSYKNISDYRSSAEWVHHTQKVISQIQRILLDVEDIETEQRGYVITGEEKYLEYYNEGLKNIHSRYMSEKELLSDNPAQLTLLDSIFKQIESRIVISKQAVAIRRSSGFDQARLFVSKGTGEMLMKQIRVLVEDFIVHEEQLLSQRLSEANKNFASAIVIVVSGISLAIILVVVSLYFFTMDYNRRIISERKVMESELRIKKMLDSLPVGVFIVDANGKPYYSNSKSEQILGRGIVTNSSAEELPETYHAYEAGTNTIYPSSKQPILKALQGEQTVGVEDIEIQKGDVRVPLRTSATYITDSEDKIEYAISVFEDITDVKKYERELKAAKLLAEESVILKETFLANMSHEIRTPMNAIIGFTDLLLKRNLGAENTDYIRTIKSSGETLLRIINDILDVSKIESGMMTFEEFPISISEIFSSLNILLSHKAREKNLQLSFESDGNVPGTVLGDPTRLTQIIINIAGNAIKFTRKGSVEVHAKLLGETSDHYMIGFSVKDTGIGIAEDKLPFIFERFRQAESHTTRNYGGTGLGLSIAKQLIELQKGTLSIKSMEGVGSVFTFSLPFRKTSHIKKANDLSHNQVDFEKLRQLKILIVEDNLINIKFIQSLFSQHGLKADVAENGKAGVNLFMSKPYDLVLMDIEMPEMNGYQTTAYIRTELKSQVPIIAMTAHAMAGEKEKCLQLGMNDYISKPINADLLFSKIMMVDEPSSIQTVTDPETLTSVIRLDFLSDSVKGNKEVILNILDLFLEQVPEDLNVLQEAIEKEDYLTIRNRSHKMKSSVSVMGMESCMSTLEEMENLGKRSENMERIKVLYDILTTNCEKAIQETISERRRFMS